MELIDFDRMKAVVERTKGVYCPPTIPLPIATVDASVEVLKALADPTRLQMVGVLKRATQPLCICDFTAAFDLSQPTISHHMGKLKDAGLVEVTKSGIWACYRLARNLDARTRAMLDVLV
jgi:ArsR family transcriptional regulator, arsenate/arsenite/antimonite-responsive transcriptional repressor